jgi:hypothetical protein
MASMDSNNVLATIAPESTRVESLDWVVIPSIVLLVRSPPSFGFVPDMIPINQKNADFEIVINDSWGFDDSWIDGLVGISG